MQAKEQTSEETKPLESAWHDAPTLCDASIFMLTSLWAMDVNVVAHMADQPAWIFWWKCISRRLAGTKNSSMQSYTFCRVLAAFTKGRKGILQSNCWSKFKLPQNQILLCLWKLIGSTKVVAKKITKERKPENMKEKQQDLVSMGSWQRTWQIWWPRKRQIERSDRRKERWRKAERKR